MAMAGLDYSHVREPDYNPDSYRQTPEVTRWIEHTGRQVLEIWKQRHDLRKSALERAGEVETRSRTVYYDTDNISENQTESLRLCRDCPGVWKIVSHSSRGKRILAIHVPRKGCRRCSETGYQWYEKENSRHLDAVYLQDRPNDAFLTKTNRPQTGDRY
jgi:hypothetical protein